MKKTKKNRQNNPGKPKSRRDTNRGKSVNIRSTESRCSKQHKAGNFGKTQKAPVPRRVNIHDRLFHNLFSHLWYCRKFMQYFLPKERLKALHLNNLKSEKNQLQTRITDCIFSLPLKKEFLKYFKRKQRKQGKTHPFLLYISLLEVFVILEHKSCFPQSIFKQMHRYFKLLQNELDRKKASYRIMGIIFSHGRMPWPSVPKQMKDGYSDNWFSPDFPARVEYQNRLRSGELIEVDTHNPAIYRIIRSKKCKIGGIMLLFHNIWGLQDNGQDVKVEDVYERMVRILEDKGPKETFMYVEEYLRSALWKLGERKFNLLWKKVKQKLIDKGLLRKGGNMMTLKEELLLQGEQKGRQAGMQAGIVKGRVESQQKVIRNMLKERLGIPVIAKVTGMSAREIKKFQNGNGRLKNGHFRNGEGKNSRVRNSRTRNGNGRAGRPKGR